MSSEPSPWDRKNFFKERKHERSEFLGGRRWRETLPPPHNHHGTSRWAMDYRSRGRSGHGKQGGWHRYSEESGHGFMRSRSNERMVEDGSCRPSYSRGDGGYYKNSRRSRWFGQREGRSHSCEAASPRRQNGAPNDQRSADFMLTCNSSHPHSEYVNSRDRSHTGDQHGKSVGVNFMANRGQRFEKNSPGLLEWRPRKWTRSGSLSSRGLSSHTSSSKSMRVDSNETKGELNRRSSSIAQSPCGDAASAAPSEEATSRKKARLSWGEGLAKFEKKNVEDPDDSATKIGTSISGDIVETGHSHFLNVADKSPRVAGLPDCVSPATPLSVACSSSPGLEDKNFVMGTDTSQDVNLSGTPIHQSHCDGLAFSLESLDLAQTSTLNASINELLQSDDLSSLDLGFMTSTALNKLLSWKSELAKVLEKTELQIDSLENELKTLISESGNRCSVPSASCYPPKVCNSKAHEDQRDTRNIARPSPLEISSEVLIGQKGPNEQKDEQTEVKVEDVDSPGSATSEIVEVPSKKYVPPFKVKKHIGRLLNSVDRKSKNLVVEVCNLSEEKASNTSASGRLSSSFCLTMCDGSLNCKEDALYNLILASNKDSAKRAMEVFSKFLPTIECSYDFSRAVSVSAFHVDPVIKERFARRKRFQQFKEKIIALKFRIFQRLWKEDIHMLSVQKYRVKSQKKFDASLRPVQTGHQKHRSSTCLRFSAAVRNLSLAPSSEILKCASRLLSDSHVKVYRNMLRMPALILSREKTMPRFISKNGLIEDPYAVEKERSIINPWTTEEIEVFINKIAFFGKDFRKIASFLDHKTTADCIEFYYKNHKSDCFERTKRKPDYKKLKSCSANTYLVASGKRWNFEANSVPLGSLGAASAIAANVEDGIETKQKCMPNYLVCMASDHKTHGHDELVQSNSFDICNSERETVAADVLAGICGSLSSEAMSSCITSSVDPGEGYQDRKCLKVGSPTRFPQTPEVTHYVDYETCSDESCGEMDPTGWTDEEKLIFIQAVSAYGKDFAMISRRVGTRSRDECKIFFGKTKNRLGLGMINPGPDNLARQDAHGGGSGAEDACVMETDSLTCDEKPGIKLEKISDLGSKRIPKPDMNCTEYKDGTGELGSVNTEFVSKNSVQGMSHADKQVVEFNLSKHQEVKFITDCEIKNGVCMQCDENVTTLSCKGGQIVGDATYNSLSDRSGPKEVSAKHLGEELNGVVSLPDHGLKNRRVGRGEVSGLNLEDAKSQVELAGINSLLATTRNVELSPVTASQSEFLLESSPECKPDVNSLKSNISVPKKWKPQGSTAESPVLDLDKVDGGQCENSSQTAQQPFSESSRLGHSEPFQIPSSYSFEGSTAKDSRDSGCNSVSLQGIQKLDQNFHSDAYSTSECFLQRCSSSNHHGCKSDLPVPIRELQTCSSANEKKPCSNGDVKLFGQILSKSSSQQIRSSNTHQSDDSTNLPKAGGNLFSKNCSLDRNSASANFECSNFLGSEKRSLCFRDESRVQTGFSSFPDSAILLAKYPAAFGNYAMPSTKMEQPPLNGDVKTSELNLNGGPIFAARDISSKAVAGDDYQVYRKLDVRPFTVDRQDMFLEMQNRNGFVVSGMQQHTREVVGTNVVGRDGILVGGQCSGVSDPVDAIKMHYAKAEQFSVQASIVRED